MDYYNQYMSGGIITGGLAARWQFREASGQTVADSSGNSRTGTLYGSPSWTTGPFSNAGALQFDGASTGVDFGDFFYADKFAITLWVNVATWDANPRSVIIKRNSSGATGGTNEWQLLANQSGGINRLQFQATVDGTTSAYNVSSVSGLSTGGWYFVGVNVPGNGGNGAIYTAPLGGSLVSGASAAQSASIVNSTSVIQMAVRNNNNNSRWFAGKIGGDCRLYSGVNLSQSEFAAIHAGAA